MRAACPEPLVDIAFAARVIEWRGPAPFFFAAIPDEHVSAIRKAARRASYGWGCVPVSAGIGAIAFTSSLFPRGGGYLLPLKLDVRRRAGIAPSEIVAVSLAIFGRDQR